MLGTCSPAGVATAAVEQVRAGLGSLSGCDLRSMSPDVRVGLVESLLGLEAQLSLAAADVVQVMHEQEDTVVEHGRTTRSFLIEELRCSTAAANRQMRLARSLSSTPDVEAALRAGEINVDHAMVILGVLPQLEPGIRDVVETVLVDLARTQPPGVLARGVEQIIARYPADDVEAQARRRYERRYAERGIGLADTIGGTRSLSGTLMPDVGAALDLALDIAGRKTGPEDDRSARQRRHDAIGEIAKHYLARGETPEINGERPRLVVTMTLQDLLTRLCLDGHALAGTLDTGIALTAATIRRLACDAEVIPAVLGGRSEVLDLGRATRTWTVAQRRAAWVRDQGRCTFPRCGRPPRELHHIEFWVRDHGPSDHANGAWLCDFHHWLVHEGGWTLRRECDGSLTFTGPRGQTPDGRRHPRDG